MRHWKKSLQIYIMTVFSGFALIIGLTKFAIAAEKKEARVTQVIRDVRLLASNTAPRPAALNESVREGTAVRTGDESRAELTFSDQTLARLGANTVFGFNEGARTYNLGSGAILMSAPRGSGAVKVMTSAATAALTGFTAIYEFHANTWSKFIVLHGDGTIVFKNASAAPCRLHTGQMMIWAPHPTRCPEVLNVDLSKLLQGKLVKGFNRPLPELDLILADIENQRTSPPSGGLIDPTSQDTIDQGINARPTPRPSRPSSTVPPGGSAKTSTGHRP